MKRAILIVALVATGACSSGTSPKTTPAPSNPTVTTISFADCQKQAEYPGGRYAVEYDNGVCKVQR